MNTSQLGAHCTRAWGPVTNEIRGMQRLQLEGLRDMGSWNGWTNLHGVLHGMQWVKFRGLLDLCQTSFKEVGPNNKTGRPWDFKFSQHLIYYDLLCGRVHMNRMVNEIAFSLKTNCVCLSTTLEGTWPQNSVSIFHGMAFRWVSRALVISWSRPLVVV